MDVLTVRETIERSKAEGLPVTEYTLRSWIKRGLLPVRRVGTKQLIYWPNLERVITCADSCDNPPAEKTAGIRRVEV